MEDLPSLPQVQVVPKPDPLNLLPVEFGTTKSGEKQVLTLDAQQYENLSRNMAELQRWISEAMAQLDYYRESLSESPAAE